jgi:hypothetical protein
MLRWQLSSTWRFQVGRSCSIAHAPSARSLVSPIAAGFAAVTALVSLLSGERANLLQLVGVGLDSA